MENLKLDLRGFGDGEKQKAVWLLNEIGFTTGYKSIDFYSFIYGSTGSKGEFENTIQFGNSNKTFSKNKGKEITIQELKDLVVLKRNSIEDATHEDYSGLKHLLLTHTRHVWGGNMWLISSADFSKFKPIQKEKVVKEYLEPSNNYSLIKAHRKEGNDWIEVPEGAMFATGSDVIFRQDNAIFANNVWNWTDVTLGNVKSHGLDLTWQREKESIIDKLVDESLPEFKHNAESEKRSHGHYFKDVSQLNEIDVYYVLKLFEVTDPCLQHIVKKALCAGKRGHKDMMEDLQNIVDTAARAVELNK